MSNIAMAPTNKKETKEQKKIAKREKLLTNKSSPVRESHTNKCRCIPCQCFGGSKIPKSNIPRNNIYNFSTEPFDGQLDECSRTNDMGNTPLNVVCESYPVPKYKAANRKQKSGVLSCLKSKTPIEERKQEEYGIQEETIESDPHHIVKRVLRDEDYPVQEPDQVQAYISHDQFDPSIPGTSDQYLVQESVEERTASPVKNYIEVKGRKGKKSSPSKESYDFNKDKYEGPLEDVEKSYDLFTLPLNDHVDTYDYPKYSPMKKNKKTTITNEYSNNYGYSTDKYDGPLENTQRTNDINDTSLADYVEHFEVPKYSPAKPKEKSPVKSDPNQKYNLSSERYEGPLEAIEKYFDMESNPINEHVESYEIPKYIPLKINTKKDIMKERTPSPAEGEDINYPSATVVTAAEIVVKSKKQKKSKKSEVSGNYNVMEQNEIDESSLTTDNLPKYEKIIINHPDEDRVIVKEDIVITQSTEEEKPSTSFVKEVTIVEPEVVKKDSINEADIRKEKSNSLSRLLGRFNRSGRRDSNHDDIVDVKKKSGTLLSDRDSGVEDPGTDAGTLPRLNEEQNELSEKKTKKQKKASLLCSSTGKKGSMAYLPIEQDTDNKVLKNYPTAEAPYEGEVLNIGRDSDLPTNDLRQNVEVYHSGNSVKQPSWNRAFAIFTRTKHDGIEDVINKENINKELYELDTTQYDGPFEVMNVQTQLETSPIQTYSKVYHSGQSFQKKGKKSSSKRQTLNAADSEEDEYHPTSKEKYSSLSRFMGLFNRPKKTETHVFSEGDSGLDGSNSSAEVPANYSISNKKVKKSKYDLDPQPFTGTYENTVKINELRTAPLTESVDIQASGSLQKTGTLDTSYDASIGSESDEEKKNTRSNTLSKFIQRFHLQKKSNGGSDNLKSFEKYPPMTESFEGNLETVELTKTMPTTPLDTSVTLYDVPKYQAKIEKPPGCLSCAVPTRKESVHMYEVKEVTEEDPRITYHHKTSIESERILYGSAAMSTDSEGSEMEETPVEEPTVNEKPFGLKLTVQRPVIPQIDEMAVVTPATDMTFEFKNKKKPSKLACLSSSSSTTSKSSASVEEIRPIGKDEINFEFYPTYDSYKGPVEQTHQNIDFETVPIREHVQLYKVKKYRARKEGDGNHMFACFGKPKLSGSARRHKKSETKSTNYSLGFERSVLVELPVANARLSVNEDENIIKEVQYEAAQPEVKIETAQLEAEIKTKKSGPSCLACVRPKAKKLDVAYESPSSVHIEHGKPKIEKDLEAAEKDLLLKTKKSGPSCFSCVSPKSKKAKLEINQEVPEVAISSDEIEQPTLHGDLELALPEKDAEVKAKKPRVASCFTCIRPQAKLEKRAYKLKQYPISATYEGPVVELKQEPLVGRANLEEHVQLYDIPKYNIKSPKCAALNCASKPKKVDLEAEVEYKPIQVSSAEIDVVKSDEAIELDVEAPKKDLDVEIKAKKASPSSCFSCITPKSKKAKLDVTTPEYVIPSAQVDIDTAIEQPAVQADLQVQPHDVDVEIKTKKMDIESPSTRVDIEQGTDHIDLEIVKPDRKLDFELEGEKPRGLLFSCMKSKPKKIDLEAEYKVEEVPAAQVEINMDKAELQEQLKESVPRGKLEGDAKIKKPRVVSCFTCIRPQAKLEKRAYKLKQYPISATYEGPVVELKQEPLVGRANLEEHVQLYDIPKYNIKSSKCAALNCASKPKKVELEAEYKPAELPTAEIKLEGPDSEIKLENPEDEIKIEVPQKEIDLKIKKEKSSPSCFACIRPKSKKAKLDVEYKAPEVGVDEIRVEQPELHADIETSIPQKEIELEVKAKKSSPSCFACVKPKSKKAKLDVEYRAPEVGVDEIRVEQPELHADIEASIPQKEIELEVKTKKSSPSCFTCVKPKSKKAKLDVEYKAPEIGVDEIRVEQPELHADIEASIPQKEIDLKIKKEKSSSPSCFACVKPKSKKAKLDVEYRAPEVGVDEIRVEQPELHADIEASIPQKEIELEVKTKKSSPSCFTCVKPKSKKAKLDVEYKAPEIGVDEIRVEQPELHADIEASIPQKEIDLKIKKEKSSSPSCFACVKPKSKKAKLDVEYRAPEVGVDEIRVEQPELHADIEASIPQKEIELEVKTKKSSPSCFTCVKPKSKKAKLDVEYKAPEIGVDEIRVEQPELHADIEASIPQKEIDLKIKKEKSSSPSCFACVKPKSKKAKLDVEYKAPEIGVDEIRVEQPELHADIEASIPQKEIELEVKAKKSSPSCFACIRPKSKKAKLDVEYRAPEVGVDEIRVEQPELHADIEASIPQKEIELEVKAKKSSPSCFACIRPKSKKAKLDVEYRAPEIGVDEIRVEQPELHADIEASIPQKEVDIRGKKSRPSCFACVRSKSKKAKLEVGYKEPEVVVPTSQMEINIQEPSIEVQSDLDLPEQKVEAKIKTKKPHAASCFACNRRQNKKMDVNSYPISGIYEGPVVQLKQEPLVAISNLDEHVELYDIPKYNVKSPKCISLNCGASKQKKIEMDTEYEPVDIEVPSTEIPEINKQVEIKVSQDNLGYKHKTSPAKASCFSCASGKKDFGTEYKKPEMILSSVEIEMPESEIRLPSVDIEMPKIELPSTDIETPKVELPSADIELPSAQIDFNPSLDVNVHAMAPKLSHDYELSFERPEGSLDAEIAETKSFSIPSVSPKTGKFEFEYKKAEIEIPKVDIPQFEVKPFDLEVQSPRIQLNKEFHVTSPEAEIAFERPATPEFNIDTEVKGKKLSVSCLSCVKSNQMDLTTEYKGTGVTLPDDDQAIEVKLATLDAAVAEKDVDVVAKAKKPKAASCLACVKPKVSKKPLVLEAYPSTEVYEGNVVGLEKEGVIPTINLKEEVELYPIPKYNLKSPKCGLFSCAAKPKKVVVDDQYTPRDLTVDQPQIEVDVSVPKKKLDVQVKTKKPSLSSRFAPKSKKVELETKLDVPADEVDVAIQQPEMHSQIEVIAPNEKLEADIKVKKPSSKCLSCVGGPKAKKERRAYQMSQYPINATYDSPVLELKQESLVPRSNLDEHVQLYDIPEYNIKSPKCASLNCASKTKKVELESEYKPVEADNPEIEVAVPEIEVTKPEIEVEVPKNKLDVEGKTKRSRSSCFSCFASPKPKKANIEVEYKAPEVAPAEIEIEEPKIHADLEVAISEKELEVKTKKSSPSCFACVRKPKSKKDKLEVEYKGPEVAPTEIEIEEPKIHADLEVTPPEKELEIKAKKSPSCFACVRKPKSKKDKLEVEYKGPEVVIPSTEVDINEPEIHADLEVTPPEKELEIKAKKSPSCFACVRKPKSKKDKLEVEYKAPEVVIPSTEVDINEPEIHADLEVTPPEKELEIKAKKSPSCFACVRKPKSKKDKLEVEYKAPEVVIPSTEVDINEPEIHADLEVTPPEKELEIKDKKSPSCFACVRKPKSKRDKFEGATVSIDHADADLEIKEPQLDASKGISCCVSPKSKKIDLDAQYHVSDLTLTTPQIKATELPTPKIKVHLPSSEFKSDASLDITSPEVHFERPDFKIEEIHKTAGYDVNYSTPKIETFDISINNDFESSYKNSDPSLNVETGSLLLRGQDIDIGKQIYKEVEIRMNTPEIKISVDEVDTPSRMSLDHSAQIHGETLQIETPHSQIDANLKTKSGGCFNCASKPKKVKHSKTNLEPYLTSDVYKGQLESVTRKDTLQTEPLSSYITLYNVPKYRPANKQPKCAKFNCLGKKQNLQIEEYTPVDKTIVANRQIGVDSLATSDNVVSAEIEPISINVDGKKISNRPSSTCGSLSCASPKQKGEVYYPNEKLDFSKYPNVETYEGEVSFLNAQTDIADQPISSYVTVYDIPKYKAANKQKGCASLNCTTTKPSGDYELTPTQIEHQIENDIETAYAVDFKEAKPTITPESTPIVTPIRDLELVGTQESSWSRFVIPEHTPDYERQGEIELKPESYLANQQAEFSFAVDEVRESPSRHQVSMNTIALDHSTEFDRSLQSSNFEKELDSTNLEKELDIIDGEKHFDASKFGSELEYSVHVEKDVSDGVSFENELPDIPVIIQSHNSEYKRKHDEMRKQSVEIAHQVEEKFHVHVDPFEEKPIIEQINDGQSPIVLPPPPPKSDKIPLITAFKCFSCIKGSAKIQRDSKNLYYTAHYPLLQETHSSELLCMNKTPDADYDSLEKSVLLQTYPKYTAKKIVASDSDDKSDSSGHDKGNKKSSKISFKFGRKRHSGASETISYKDVNLDEYKLTSALYEGELESVKREDEIKTLPIKEYANPIHKGYYKNLRKQKTKSLPTSDSGISEGESISSEDSPDARNLQKTCAPFTACMPSKHKKLDSPYRKVETGKPQPFGYSTEKYTGELEALDMHKELGSQELVSAVDVYHNGDSYDKLDKKTSSQFHLIPFCVSKQQPSTPPTVRVTTCTLSSSLNKNDQLGLLEFQRISDGSHTQTSLFSTVDPSGDLQCQLDVTRAQKMDCECRVVVCQSGLNDCDRFCKFPRSYQSVTTTITMNKNGGPSSANSTKSPSASFFSMIKKPFTNNQSSKNNQNEPEDTIPIGQTTFFGHFSFTTKKSKKTASDKAGKNTPSPHSKSSDSDAVEVYDTKAGLNDKSKLNSQNSATNYSLETPILSNNMVVNHSNINPQQQSSNQDNAPVTLTQRDPVHEGQTNLRSSVIMDSTVLPLDQNSSGPYKEAEPSDYALIRENKIETVFKLRGNTGQAPDFSSDSPDMSLSSILSKCVEKNSVFPKVEMICRDEHVKDYGYPDAVLTDESLPHTTVQSWQETDIGPEVVFEETDSRGKVVKKTVKTQQTRNTITRQSYQTFNLDNEPIQTIDRTQNIVVPRNQSASRIPVLETRTRTIAYECRPEEALCGPDDVVPGDFVSSNTVTQGNKTIESVTYKTEKEGIVSTHTEHKVIIHSEDGIDHDAELSKALIEATSMDPDKTVEIEKIEISQKTQN